MKQGNTYQSLVMILLAVGLVAYFAFHIFDGLYNPLTTVYAYDYSMSETTEVNGFVVRDEVVLPSYSGLVEARVVEGERVAEKSVVALVYDDADAKADQIALQALQQELELLNYVTAAEGDTLSAAHQDEIILQSVVNLRVATATEDYGALEHEILELKSTVLKRAYIHGVDLDAQVLSTRKAEVVAEYRELEKRTAAATTRVTAPKAGSYSTFVDGYEGQLSPDTMSDLTPSDLVFLSQQGLEGDAQSVGKLIMGIYWYLVVAVPTEATDKLHIGDTIIVRFTGDFDGDISMKIQAVGEPAGGQSAVVLSSDEYMAETTLLREQTVELVYDIQTGIRVPKDTLRIETRTITDKETGVESEERILGVYAVVGQQAEFKPVETIAEGQDFYVVVPTKEGKTALRSGDELIIYAKDLYDGKPVR